MYKKLAITLSITSVLFASGCNKEVSYSKDVKPILTASCVECHDGKGEGSEESGLILLTYEDLMQGTNYGQVVVPGNGVSSTFYRLIAHETDRKLHMPPHHKEAGTSRLMAPLSDKEIETVKTWIDEGAKNN